MNGLLVELDAPLQVGRLGPFADPAPWWQASPEAPAPEGLGIEAPAPRDDEQIVPNTNPRVIVFVITDHDCMFAEHD